MSKMSDNSVNKILVGVLVFLCVAIVGLGVGIGVLKLGQGDTDSLVLEDGETVSVAASDLYDEMVQKFESDPNYTSEDARKECNDLIDSTENGNYAINLIISCGVFVNNYGEGAGAAAEYMEEKGGGVSLDGVQIGLVQNYYYSLYDYYKESGNSEKTDYYSDLMVQVMEKAENNAGGVYEGN